MALTNAEIEYIAKMPVALRAIEKQLIRIANALEKRKEINRVFHDLKHDFIMLNPRDLFAVQPD